MNKLKKTLSILLLTITLLSTSAGPVVAIVNPTQTPNNKVGIHILQREDIEDAKNLVNSSGGEWGYVTLVIQDNDRNKEKWQGVFDELREKKLIPIVRIATHQDGQNWNKPSLGEAPGWASFLNSLNWVVKNRYVILFNEPNHAREWGGEINPKEYAQVVSTYSKALKAEDRDFFILNAGFDSSAPQELPNYMDEAEFLSQMVEHDPSIFKNLDGWSSHSYPNPAFSASPYGTGRTSIKSYKWETDVLKRLGEQRDLPIFITETGWSAKNLSETQIASYYSYSFNNVWNDPQVVAVTPFVINYQAEPFDHFSWKQPNGFRNQYQTVQSLSKTKGEPVQLHRSVLAEGIRGELFANSGYFFALKIDNKGQSIWKTDEGYDFLYEAEGIQVSPLTTNLYIKPSSQAVLPIQLTTPKEPGEYKLKITLRRDGQTIDEPITQTIKVAERTLLPEVEGASIDASEKRGFLWRILRFFGFDN